jgi:hypothetical protein
MILSSRQTCEQFVPERASVTGPFYATKVLPEVVKHYNNARPSTGTRGIRLLHDNATVHKSAVMKECTHLISSDDFI